MHRLGPKNDLSDDLRWSGSIVPTHGDHRRAITNANHQPRDNTNSPSDTNPKSNPNPFAFASLHAQL